MKKTKSKINNSNLILIGKILSVASVILFVVLPRIPAFFDYFCNPGPSGEGCGYANLGIRGYALYAVSVPLVMGIIFIIVGMRKSK